MPGLARFVGGHPMAGAASAGAAAARADLFDGKPWFLVPAAQTAARSSGVALRRGAWRDGRPSWTTTAASMTA